MRCGCVEGGRAESARSGDFLSRVYQCGAGAGECLSSYLSPGKSHRSTNYDQD